MVMLCEFAICECYHFCTLCHSQTSAKDATNVDQAFYHIANQAIQNKFGHSTHSLSDIVPRDVYCIHYFGTDLRLNVVV